ncbi:phosphoadenosine phosphosulfate reductase family protein [Cytobacillus gottheilii]|uniref:phosphoadenosine phosphosulfate reductase domain-containing protein n=1 Tax=Cytobacillus gottheilii TaxID=859144 RepID=UPI002495A64E|nr:phosphoadenosine phosphosulfate reductase family protein [Cytobacillus gottheilii]
MNNIVFFSGGLSSFAVADYVKKRGENTVLYFTDTLVEDEDLYRFIFEVSDKLELPLLIHSKGITPVQLMVKQKFMANSRVGTCSKELKMKVAADYLTKGTVPEIEKWHNKQFLKDEEFMTNATLYFGIDLFEAHREKPIRDNWEKSGFTLEFPLLNQHMDARSLLQEYQIPIPAQYLRGFSHNNCGGACVKAGIGHFKNLLIKKETLYNQFMEQEIIISEYIRYTKQPAIKKGIQPDYMFNDVYEFVSTGKKSDKIKNILECHKYTKNWKFGIDSKGRDIKKPYTFMKGKSLADLEKEPAQCDMFDIGGCGCFFDFEEIS